MKKKKLSKMQLLCRAQKEQSDKLQSRIKLLKADLAFWKAQADDTLAHNLSQLTQATTLVQAHALTNTTEYMRELQDRVRSAANILWPGTVKQVTPKPAPPERQPLGQ